MAIFTILKSNIRHGKGSFTSIIILMVIVILAFTTTMSIKDNCEKSISKAYDSIGAGEITAALKEEDLTEEMLGLIKNNKNVDHVTVTEGVFCDKATFEDEESQVPWLMRSFDSDSIKVFKENITGYIKSPEPLEKGEIYVALGAGSLMHFDIGDTLNMSIAGQNYALKVKGFVEDPIYGMSALPSKIVYVSDADLSEMREKAENAKSDDRILGKAAYLNIYRSDSCSMTDSEFQSVINKESSVIDYSIMSMKKSSAIMLNTALPDIIMNFMVAFIIVLIVVVMIIMGNSISTSIEMNYTDLGIMKSQGFNDSKIKALYVLQNLIAESIGCVIGLILVIPLMKVFGGLFQPMTSVLSSSGISLGKSLLLILAILIISCIYIVWVTRKVGKVSPVRAITGNSESVYFDSALNAPISKKNLSFSLAFRQFTSCKRRYAASIIVASCLVFFLITIMGLANSLSSKTTLENMNGLYYELTVDFKDDAPTDELLEEIDKLVENDTPIEKKYYMSEKTASIEGNSVNLMVYKNDIDIPVYKGRMPQNNNEIMVSEGYVDEYSPKVGDKVVVSYLGKNSEYIISGFCKNTYYVAMNLDGSKKLGIDDIDQANYNLRFPNKGDGAAEAINQKYGERLEAKCDTEQGGEIIDTALNGIRLSITVFAILFAFVTVSMVCKKAFIQEKTDIGIYKSVGFRSSDLRLQFALRFFIVATLGSVLGILLGLLFSGKFVLLLLSSLDIDEFPFRFTPDVILIPVIAICICFFVFAYIISRKVKSVEIKDLVTE